ncbi:MAG: hypothetical protein AABX13_00705 [Nanoarchaeota archaeon]
MGKIIHLEDYLPPRSQPALVSVTGTSITTGYLEHVLALIENTSQHRGVLLAENFTEGNRRQLPSLHKAHYLRNGKRPYYSFFMEVYFQERDELKICCTDRDFILPAPSRQPYLICGIEREAYHRLLQQLFERKIREKKLMEEMVTLLSEGVPLAWRREGLFWRRKKLITPEGYADQIQQWQEMVERLRF